MDINQAKKQVEALKGYYIHLLMYVSIIGLLAVVDYSDGGGWWVIWPMVGWGMVVLMHTVAFFFGGTFLGEEWEKRKINELMQKSGKI